MGCPVVVDSVCGIDGVTYNNICHAKCNGVSDFKCAKSCDKCDNSPKCACPVVVDPVCGIDGVTYNNICHAKCNGVSDFKCAKSCDKCDKCPKCGRSKKGEVTCCGKGGSWKGKCGDFGQFEYTWVQGVEACANVEPKHTVPERVRPPACDKCVVSQNGGKTCCGKGGSWEGQCGRIGDTKFQHTWVEGIKVCKKVK